MMQSMIKHPLSFGLKHPERSGRTIDTARETRINRRAGGLAPLHPVRLRDQHTSFGPRQKSRPRGLGNTQQISDPLRRRLNKLWRILRAIQSRTTAVSFYPTISTASPTPKPLHAILFRHNRTGSRGSLIRRSCVSHVALLRVLDLGLLAEADGLRMHRTTSDRNLNRRYRQRRRIALSV
jgi:hypothetical protein